MTKHSRSKPARALVLALSLAAGYCEISAQDFGRRDTDFKITIQARKDFPPGYDAHLKSTATYPCTGYDIRTGISWKQDTLTLDIGGFRAPSPCVALPAPATGSVYLGDIGSGTYILRIRYRGDEDLHCVTLTNGRATFRSIQNDFTSIQWK